MKIVIFVLLSFMFGHGHAVDKKNIDSFSENDEWWTSGVV